MSYEILKAHIETQKGILTVPAQIRQNSHYQSSLNLLFKLDLCTESNLVNVLTEDLDETIEKCRSKLKENGNADVRGPLSKIRRLSELYTQLIGSHLVHLTFSEILQEAINKKFGAKNVSNVDITPLTQHEIKSKKMTFREIATMLIIDSKEYNPDLWPRVNIKPRGSVKTLGLSSASQTLKNYITGDELPSERVSEERILYIERWFAIPKYTLVKKVVRKSIETKREINNKKRNAKKLGDVVDKKKEVDLVLSPDLKRFYDEYSAFKISGIQPILLNVTDEMLNDEYADIDLVVTETSKRSNKKWTKNARGVCGSQLGFFGHLLSFQVFCLYMSKNGDNNGDIAEVYKNINTYKDVTTEHLTQPKAILDYANACLEEQKRKDFPPISGSASSRLLNLISRTTKDSCYLYFCALKGDRDINKFFRDLSFICKRAPNLIEKCKKEIKERGKGHEKGKKDIKFLLNIEDPDQRRKTVFNSNKFLIESGEVFLRDSERLYGKAKTEKSVMKRNKFKNSSAASARDAYSRIKVALISEVSFISALRSESWGILHYYNSVEEQELEYPSLTFHRKKNQYQLFFPTFGPEYFSQKDSTRFMKNSDAKNAQNIDFMLPETFTPLIKKFLYAREIYLRNNVIALLPEVLRDAQEDITKFENALLNPDDKIFSDKKYQGYPHELLKSSFSIYIEELNKDIEKLSNFNEKKCKLLLPHLSLRLTETRVVDLVNIPSWKEKRLCKRSMIINAKTLSTQHKDMTRKAYEYVLPDTVQEGLFMHSNRHLSVCTYLDKNPGEFLQAASILNDEVEQVILKYGDRDKARAQNAVVRKNSDNFKY